MKTIELTQGYVALVDDEDYGLCVSMGPWHAKIKRKTALSRDIVYAAHTSSKWGKHPRCTASTGLYWE